MKKIIQITITFFLLVPITIFGQVFEEPNCFECPENSARGYKSMATGLGNTVSGDYSAAFGQNNSITGSHAFAFGRNCQVLNNYAFALGYDCDATALYSFAIGKNANALQRYALAMGKYSEAAKKASVAIGTYLKANNDNSIVIGKGDGVSNRLENSILNSLMIGFASSVPTFFVEESPDDGLTGRIGIGNITSPVAKLHIRGDNDASRPNNASLFIQSAGDYYSTLWLGDQDHYIKTKSNEDLLFNAANENFIFEGGNIGIGIDNPHHPLHVDGNIMVDGDASSLLFAGGSKTDWGEWGIEYENGGLNFWKPAGSNHFGNYYLFLADDGNVGIGTDTEGPQAKLDVRGDIRFTGQLYDENGLYQPSPWANNVNGIFYTDGNLGIGTSASPAFKLEVGGDIFVDGSINFSEGLLQNGQPFETTKWQENTLGLYYNGGKVGIGTDTPGERLEVDGNITAQHINVSGIKLNNTTQGAGKLLQSDASGNATWVDPPPTDDGDWTINGSDIYREDGMVGIGTQTPSADLHINNDVVDITTTFLEIENNGTGIYGSGSTSIGKWAGSGPFILQKAGTGLYYTGNEGLRLAFVQKNKNDTTGLSISTYMNYNGSVHFSDIYAEVSSLYLRANKTLFIRSGGNSPLVFETNGDNTDQGTRRMEINRYGQVGIGTTQHEDQNTLLTVAGRIHAQEVKVTAGAGKGADFVFDEEYNLPGLAEIDAFIKTNKHLPGIPSAEEMQNEGLDLGEMQIKLLQKIEELTLYVIELKKENEEMRVDNEKVKAEIEKLRRR